MYYMVTTAVTWCQHTIPGDLPSVPKGTSGVALLREGSGSTTGGKEGDWDLRVERRLRDRLVVRMLIMTMMKIMMMMMMTTTR